MDGATPEFITIESIDGLGKTTQIQLLCDYLTNKGISVYRTKEPGDSANGSQIGASIRNILFGQSGSKNLAPGVSDLLFLADHVQNSHDIQGKLEEGFWVVSDRYADSQFAYLHSPSKRCPGWAMDLYRQQYGTLPSVIIFLEAMPDETGTFEWALNRAKGRVGVESGKQDGKAWNTYEAQKQIQQGYSFMFDNEYIHKSKVNRDFDKKYSDRVLTIPVQKEDTVEDVHQNILTFLRVHLSLKKDPNGKVFKK